MKKGLINTVAGAVILAGVGATSASADEQLVVTPETAKTISCIGEGLKDIFSRENFSGVSDIKFRKNTWSREPEGSFRIKAAEDSPHKITTSVRVSVDFKETAGGALEINRIGSHALKYYKDGDQKFGAAAVGSIHMGSSDGTSPEVKESTKALATEVRNMTYNCNNM